MPVTTRASAKIDYSRRDVFVSSFPGEAGGRLAEPIAVRIRNNSDEDSTAVRWYADEDSWKPGELQQWLEVVTDLVLLLDDELVGALREARFEQLAELAKPGLELLAVLAANDARAKAGVADVADVGDRADLADRAGPAGEVAPARLWLAKAETLRLVALKKVAGRAEWNLDQRDRDGLLHWLYDAEEKVLMHQDKLVNKKIVGADETRLGKNVERFVDHEPQRCSHCGQDHGQP